VLIKAHPGMPADRIKGLRPPAARLVEDDIYGLFKEAKVVIGMESGALLEAASLGIPSILIKSAKGFGCYNPFPEYGKGILWEEVDTPEGLMRQIAKVEDNYKAIPGLIQKTADEYRNLFFCEPTEENIGKAFDI